MIEGDCMDPDIAHPTGVNVFLYDGRHSSPATRDALVTYTPYMADRFVLLLDDWSVPAVKIGYAGALKRAPWSVEWQVELPGDHGDLDQWYCGLLVALISKVTS